MQCNGNRLYVMRLACVLCAVWRLRLGGRIQHDWPLLAQVAADLNGDGVVDRAVLTIGSDSDEVDLAVYLSAAGGLPGHPTVRKKAFGWRGLMAGGRPSRAAPGLD
jgi:hypothetical protein